MAIVWKPTGTLDINTAPTDLPEQSNGGNAIVSGSMTRCKNLRLDRHGIASLRYGSTLVSAFTPADVPDLILEVGGHRYIFAGNEIFYDETLTSDIINCAAPVMSPSGGSYTSLQTITITTTTSQANIYYTINNTTPNSQSTLYNGAFVVPANTYVKAIAIDSRGLIADSAVTTEYYSFFAQDALVSETNSYTLITETDSNTITTEGP